MDKKDIFSRLTFDSNAFKYITDHYVILNYDIYQKHNVKVPLVDFSKMKLNESITALNVLNNCEIEETVWNPVNCKTELYISGIKFNWLEKMYKRFVHDTRHQIQKEFDKHIKKSSSEVNNIIPEDIINNITPEDIKDFVEKYYKNHSVSKDDDEEVNIQLSMTTNRKELKDIFEKYYDVSIGDFMTMTMYSNHNEELDKILCMLCSKEVLFELGTRIGEILACLNNLKQTEQNDENQKNIDHAFNEANELYKKILYV